MLVTQSRDKKFQKCDYQICTTEREEANRFPPVWEVEKCRVGSELPNP